MDIIRAQYIISCPRLAHCPQDHLPEFAFTGRSNVGKSSLLNFLCQQKRLTKVSRTPGKTKLMNFFLINDQFYLVDFPGYGYGAVSRSERRFWAESMAEYFDKRTNLRLVFVLIDASIPAQKIDLDFIEHLHRNRVPFCLTFTKIDKQKQAVIHKNVRSFLQLYGCGVAHLLCSSKDKIGRAALLSQIEHGLCQ